MAITSRQKRTTALMTAMYKYSGRLTIRRACNRGCQAVGGSLPCVDNRAPSRLIWREGGLPDFPAEGTQIVLI